MTDLQKKIEDLLNDSDQTVQEIYELVEQQLGFVPTILKSMAECPDILIPSVLSAYFLLGEPKALDRKTAELIAFACAVTVRGDACTKVHMNEARKAGASKQELFDMCIGSLAEDRFLEPGDVTRLLLAKSSYAYPIYRKDYAGSLDKIMDYLKRYNLLATLGRCGEFMYMDVDKCVQRASVFADNLLQKLQN